MRNNIEEFEITKEHFEEVYKKYGEKIPFEGFARNDLIKEAINNGWIRIREYTGYWSINCRNIEEQKEIIDKFIKEEIFDKKTILINGEIY